MVLEPVCADHHVANDQGEMLAPLLGDGFGEIAVALRPVRRSGDLDLDNEERERDCENRVAEPFEAVEPSLCPVSPAVGELGHGQANKVRSTRLLRLKATWASQP